MSSCHLTDARLWWPKGVGLYSIHSCDMSCDLTHRYNISTADYDAWTDSDINGSLVRQNAQVYNGDSNAGTANRQISNVSEIYTQFGMDFEEARLVSGMAWGCGDTHGYTSPYLPLPLLPLAWLCVQAEPCSAAISTHFWQWFCLWTATSNQHQPVWKDLSR